MILLLLGPSWRKDTTTREFATSQSNVTVGGLIPTKGNELLFINIFISSLCTHTKPPPFDTQCLEKFGDKWGTECHNTRFPLPTLLYIG